MPLPPSTPRRSSNNRQSTPATPKSADTKASGLYDNSSVQDRIRQWQSQGAAYTPAPDAISVRSVPSSDIERPQSGQSRSRPTSSSNENDKPLGTTAKRKTTRWIDPDSKEWVREIRNSSTPRKRVISDNHWKAKGSSSEPQTANVALKQGYREKYLEEDNARNASSSREEREERRRRRRESRRSRTDDEARLKEIYGTAWAVKMDFNDQEPTLGNEDPERRIGLDNELGRRFNRSPATRKVAGSPKEPESILPDEEDQRHRRRSKYAETLGSSQEPSDQLNIAKSTKGSIFSKTKDMFSKTEAPPPLSHQIPSIEAWLEEQPDPFVDDEEAPVEVPPPLKPRTRRRVSAEAKSQIFEDSNQIWQNVTPSEPAVDGRRRKRRSRDAQTPYEAVDSTEPDVPFIGCVPVKSISGQSQDMSPGGLKRRGARLAKSRDKSLGNKEKTPEPIPVQASKMAISPSEIVDSQGYYQQPKSGRACPPTGAHQLTTIASVETFNSHSESADVPDFLARDGNGLKRRLTAHEDLMSQLSLSRGGRSLRTAKSMRNVREGTTTMTAQEILNEVVADEGKYIRELQTLVDGVIPVLLQCVLSKSDSVAAAALFTSSASARDDLAFTKPIIDMGVALERLKSLHSRIPTHNLDSLLSWAQSAERSYEDYLKAWRLGFQDVVVNLAPKNDDMSQTEKGMARDKDGDVVNSEGKKVDVAYLLKRPLVRIKKLGKTFDHVYALLKSSKAQKISDDYNGLTDKARTRSQEEQGRLEDEEASNTDVTKARDLRTMAAATGVSIHKSMKVKARDCFNMSLYHSTGQRIDCRIELILRENQTGSGAGGDLLLCEVEDNGKWLFFPPIDTKTISARKGDKSSELIVMVRGLGRQEWHELLELKAEDEEAANEWQQMLGSNPLPPKLKRSPSFLEREEISRAAAAQAATKSTSPSMSGLKEINLEDIEVPIGEPSRLDLKDNKGRQSSPTRTTAGKSVPKLNLGGGLQQRTAQQHWTPSSVNHVHRRPVGSTYTGSSDRSTISADSGNPSESSWSRISRVQESSTSLRRGGVARGLNTESGAKSPSSPKATATTECNTIRPEPTSRKLSRTDDASREWMSSSELQAKHSKDGRHSMPTSPVRQESPALRPGYHRTLSSTPSEDPPTISKLRTASDQPAHHSSTSSNNSIGDQWAALSGKKENHSPSHTTPRNERRRRHERASGSIINTEDVPVPPPHRDRSGGLPTTARGAREEEQIPPASPHKEIHAKHSLSNDDPVLKPKAQSSPQPNRKDKRRSSSPLKHEYAPSISNIDSSEESDLESSSDTSEDLASENGDAPTPLVAVSGMRRQSKHAPPSSFRQPPSTRTASLAPSDSASQGPYRAVPGAPPSQKRKAIGVVCSWSNEGMWQPVHPDECSIVVSPGLVEVFEMNSAHSNSNPSTPDASRSSSIADQPLVAFELTINVFLHGGTALDITLRSPPTPNSRIKCSSTVLFRNRTMQEKLRLYEMLNWARINNPTMAALQAARARERPAVTFAVGEAARHSRSTSGFFGFGGGKKGSSYRASSAPTPSIGGETTESTGSMMSAFSALKRFSAGSAFALNRSSVLRRAPGSASRYSSSQSGSSTPAPSQNGVVPKDGPNVPTTSAAAVDGGGIVNNMKVRLHIRQKNQSKWVNLGAARLTIMPASSPAPTRQPSGSGCATPTDDSGAMPRLPSSSHTPQRVHGTSHEKRILLTSTKLDKDGNTQTFLDAVLGEECFERIQRVGIAINVWQEEERIKREGGVLLGTNTVWCISFHGERECGWVYGLVGRYRYEGLGGS